MYTSWKITYRSTSSSGSYYSISSTDDAWTVYKPRNKDFKHLLSEERGW
jgi:hypothetical protein